MRSQCPGCGALYKITPEYLGRQTRCKKCGHNFVIEAVSNETLPPEVLPPSDPQPSSHDSQATPPEQEAVAPEIKMAAQSQCPGCGALYYISQEHLGQNLQCQNCGDTFVIEAVANGDPKLAVQPLSTSQPQSQTQPIVKQASQMVQVTCQHCGAVNQMPPMVACNCGHCGQLLPVYSPTDQICTAQASPQSEVQPQPTVRIQPAFTSKISVGQVLSKTLSTVCKDPGIFFEMGFAIGFPAVVISFINAQTIKLTADDLVIMGLKGIISFIAYFIIAAGATYAVFKVLRQEEATIKQVKKFGYDRLEYVLVAAILFFLAVAVGLLFFVVPGVILAVLLSMTIPVCATERLGAIDSLKRSAELTKGYRVPIFGLYLISGLLIVILELLFGVILDNVIADRANLSPMQDLAYAFCFALLDAFPLAFEFTMTALIYFRLREIKENVTLDNLAGAFELNKESETSSVTP
jgi:DNA-directed RNA polymerase, subunit M/Transcription elongation factor TFIIS